MVAFTSRQTSSDLNLVDEVLGVVAQFLQDLSPHLTVDVVVEQHGLVACAVTRLLVYRPGVTDVSYHTGVELDLLGPKCEEQDLVDVLIGTVVVGTNLEHGVSLSVSVTPKEAKSGAFNGYILNARWPTLTTPRQPGS